VTTRFETAHRPTTCALFNATAWNRSDARVFFRRVRRQPSAASNVSKKSVCSFFDIKIMITDNWLR
jgi:hypothetical protein